MYDVKRKGAIYHKLVVDADTKEMICICGAPKCDASGKKQAKFHNRSSEYNGVIYDSALEMRYAIELDWRLKAKEILSWERQIKISFNICLECARICLTVCPEHQSKKPEHLWNYFIDFVVHCPDKTTEYVEVKGMELMPWKRNWKLMEAVFGNKPNIKLTVVKEYKNRL